MLTQYPNPMFEFMFDSARAVINLFLSGTIARCPNITFIIPHAGGALPPLIERFTSFTAIIGGDQNLTTEVVKDTFAKQFYFDLAGFPFPDQIWGLLRYIGTDRLLYGSDFPYTPDGAVVKLAEVMTGEMRNIWSEEERKAILIGNARRLLGIGKSAL
jgi:6-methylsalicylate decarboxylase